MTNTFIVPTAKATAWVARVFQTKAAPSWKRTLHLTDAYTACSIAMLTKDAPTVTVTVTKDRFGYAAELAR